jgi:hypothetical protein
VFSYFTGGKTNSSTRLPTHLPDLANFKNLKSLVFSTSNNSSGLDDLYNEIMLFFMDQRARWYLIMSNQKLKYSLINLK